MLLPGSNGPAPARGVQNTPMSFEKTAALLKLARLRQSTRLVGYACIADFHDGIYECDHVSPYTKSGSNVDAKIMVIGQDWASADALASSPPDLESAQLGYSPGLPTNRNLDDLLARHFDVDRADCYLTNIFPFSKPGGMSAGIGRKDLVHCAKTFTLEEIRIVAPKIVICLGLETFLALRAAAGIKGSLNMAEAIASPFIFENSSIHCVAHTGALGTNNRGRGQVERDWSQLSFTVAIRNQDHSTYCTAVAETALSLPGLEET